METKSTDGLTVLLVPAAIARKVVRTNVTAIQLATAIGQGGFYAIRQAIGMFEAEAPLWVECPADWCADDVTVEDILTDRRVQLVSESDARPAERFYF